MLNNINLKNHIGDRCAVFNSGANNHKFAGLQGAQRPTPIILQAQRMTSPCCNSAKNPCLDLLTSQTFKGCHERPLNGLERFFYEIARQGDNDTVSGYRVQFSSGLPSLEALKLHVADVQNDIPALKTQIQREGEALIFKESDPVVPLSLTEVTVDNDKQWQQILTNGLIAPFDPAVEPLVKFVVARNSESGHDQLLAITHHSLIDGEGMLHVYQKLIDKINESKPDAMNKLSSNEKTVELINKLVPKPLPASCDLYLQSHALNKPKTSYLIRNVVIDFIEKKLMPLFHSEKLQPKTQLQMLEFDDAQSKALITSAKRHGVTIYGALAAAAIGVAKDYFPSNALGQYVTIFTPVSLRQRLDKQPEAGEMGCYTSLVRGTFFQPSEAQELDEWESVTLKFWQQAQKMQGAVKQSLANKEHEVAPYMFEEFFKLGLDARLLSTAVEPDTFILNNLGRQQLTGADVTHFSWVSSFGQLAPGVSINFLSFNGRLQIGLFSRRFDAPTLAKFKEQFKAELMSAIN